MKRYILLFNSIFLLLCNALNIWLGFSFVPTSNMNLLKGEILFIFYLVWLISTILEMFLLIKRRYYNLVYIPGIELLMIINVFCFGYGIFKFLWYYSLSMGGFYPT